MYIALDGEVVEIEGPRHKVSSDGIIRIGAETIYSVRDATDDEEQTWIMVVPPNSRLSTILNSTECLTMISKETY